MKKIRGQVIYMGPHLSHLGLGYGNIFRDGIHEHLYESIAACPALGQLFIHIENCATVRKELAFDYAHNMRGTHGQHVTFYREVQKWLAKQQKNKQQKPTPSSGITIEQSHA